MLKKFFIAFSALLILTTGILTIFREDIFVSSIKINFDNSDVERFYEAVITKDGIKKTVNKSCLKYKLKTKYNSKVNINITSKDSSQIVMIKNGYKRYKPEQFKNNLKITKSADKISIEIEKVNPNSKILTVLFEHPFRVFSIISILLTALMTGIYFYLKQAVYIYQNNKTDMIIFFLKTLFVMTFCAIILLQITSPFWNIDTSYNSVVAKNIALGYGYSYFHDGVEMPFPAEVSTGFPMMFFTAMFIKIFSNTCWAPQLACSILMLILLAITLYLPIYFKPESKLKLWSWRCLFLIFLIFTTTNYFSSLMGEGPSILFIIISTFLLYLSKDKNTCCFFAGIFASLAYCTKVISVMYIAPIVFVYALYKFNETQDIKIVIKNILVFIAGFSLPVLLFEAYKFVSSGSVAAYLDIKKDEINFFCNNGGSGLPTNKELEKRMVTLGDKILTLINNLGVGRILVLLFTPLIIFYNFLKKIIKNNKVNIYYSIITGFVLASFCNIVWFITLSARGYFRHYLIGFVLFVAALSLCVYIINNKNKIVIVMLLMLFLTYPIPGDLFTKLFDINQNLNNIKKENACRLQAAEFIKTNPQNTYFTLLFRRFYDIEYLLPDKGIFYDAANKESFNKEIKNKVLLREKYLDWEDFYKKYYAIRYTINQCKTTIFENDIYIFQKCN